MHLQIPLHDGVLSEDAIGLVARVPAVGAAADLVALLEGPSNGAADFDDGA
jgi:hypothetical protein